ncbi:hypothetical protein CTAYLR_004839 [Chrysophaeum taylorii]|uniref:Uncharacterized protein n=1 Tax=Chrysophaeum taylorii TaxID=2483200 RepID=A0AAD7XIY7_9STRA|nr:hypothetical protein CTAYLR_004839 [Chrysophaeum taylorii]
MLFFVFVNAAAEAAGCSDSVCGRYCTAAHKCYRSSKCAGVGVACAASLNRSRHVRGLVLGLKDARPQLGTCAVVSSSDALLGRDLGPRIDACDEVFRINMAPVTGFERAVGATTTFAVTNAPSWLHPNEFVNRTVLRRDYFDSGHKRPVVFVQDPLVASESVKCGFKHTANAYRLKASAALRACTKLGGFRCILMNRTVVDAAWRVFCAAVVATRSKSLAPSTGLVAVVEAATRCRRLVLFGFGNPTRKGHYYAPARRVGPELHGAVETAVFRIWQQADPARFEMSTSEEERRRRTT